MGTIPEGTMGQGSKESSETLKALEAISKMQMTLKDTAPTDEKAESAGVL